MVKNSNNILIINNNIRKKKKSFKLPANKANLILSKNLLKFNILNEIKLHPSKFIDNKFSLYKKNFKIKNITNEYSNNLK